MKFIIDLAYKKNIEVLVSYGNTYGMNNNLILL